MSSRRPMTRSFSGNGRSGSLSEEDVPAPNNRSDPRNYLTNVRPENSYTSHRYSCYKPSRSTLCTVMAQLTEETQPLFESTVKSKAVCEDCNVKFSCEVSGYPVPELTWYKDDTEMDRYCGLPKYEIFRNGKVHTLHIYNCTEEDAAIYQASARNSKGIVSCSGVLEVGTMNEYKIHQKFFAKLKLKADTKRKELEESRRRVRGKENVQVIAVPEQLCTVSPEPPPRKRRSPGEPGPRSSSTSRDGEAEAKIRAQEAEAKARLHEGGGDGTMEPPAATAKIPNGFPADARVASGSDPNQEAMQENGNQDLMCIYETVEIVTTTSRRANKEPLATKRPKISNGVDSREGSSESEKGTESKSDAGDEGGMSLAQYLAESMKSQAYDDKQNSTEKVMEVDVMASPGKEKAAQTEPPAEVKAEAQSNVSKKQETPNGQGSLSAVFFSLRDMLFGSKDNVNEVAEDGRKHNHIATAEKVPPSAPPQPRSSPKMHWRESEKCTKDLKVPVGKTVKMEVEEQPLSGGADPMGASPQHITAREVQGDAAMPGVPGPDGRTQGDTIPKSPESPALEEPRETAAVAARFLHEPGGSQERTGEAYTPPACMAPLPLLSEDTEDRVQTEKNRAPVGQYLVLAQHEPDAQVGAVFTSAGGQVTTDAGETDTLHDCGQTAPAEPEHRARPHSGGSGEISTETKADPQNLGLENMGCQESISGRKVSPTVNSDPLEVKPVKEGGEHVKENAVESGDGNSQKSQVNAFVEESVDVKGEESPLSAAQEMGAGTLETQEEGEKEVADRQTIQPVAVELKPPDFLQKDEAVAGVPEVKVLESRIADAPDTFKLHFTPPNLDCVVPELPQQEGTLVSVPKIDILESPKELLTQEWSLSQPVTTEVSDIAIPVINVCLSEDSKLLSDSKPHKSSPPTVITPTVEEPPKVPTFVVPPISVTCVDSPPESINNSKDGVKEIELLLPLAHGANNDIDLEKKCVSPTSGGKEEISIPPPVSQKVIDGKEPGKPIATGVPSDTLIINQIGTPDLSSSVDESLMEVMPPLISGTEQSQEKPADEPQTIVNQLQQDKLIIESLSPASPEAPVLSPTTLRRFAAKGFPGLEAPVLMAVPAIRVDDTPSGEKRAEEGTGGDTPPAIPSCESSPRLRRKDSLTPIPSATPQELASGARRKIFLSKSKGEGSEGSEKEEVPKRRTLSQEQEAPPYMSPSQSRKSALLQPPTGQQTPPTERRSPLLSRKKVTLEVPKRHEEAAEDTDTAKTDSKPQEKDTLDPFKAPQVIRKIRGEPFPDALGHLKLWCQFFNVLSDSTIKWYRDEVEIAEVKRSAGDESQVALAIAQTSSRDCGVYACSIKNEYGTDTTDFLLSVDILSNFLLREDLEVGEEIEMTPMLFTKGLADPGYWGDKFFGRIMTEEVHIGEGCAHKACKVKVIYGLEPVFESGSTCIIKVRNPIAYGTKDERNLAERNLVITKQECKIQNTVREYCKVFAAEARVIENFGPALEMLPRYLMYRPANTVPYVTVEVDLQGMFLKYCLTDATGRMIMRSSSEVEQKCCTFQHWIHQWTNGNLLVTQLEGVGMRLTNVGIATKSKGYQGLSDNGSPKQFEQFVSQHQCNYYCGLLGLRPLKPVDSQPQPAKIKGTRSPLLNRRAGSGTSSPQLQRKGVNSPQGSRKATSSPKVARKSPDSGENGKPAPKPKTAEAPKVVGTR